MDIGVTGARLTPELIATGQETILTRIERTLGAVDGEFPFIADTTTGAWTTTTDGDWCGGHWVGLLWLASTVANDPTVSRRFARAAEEYSKKLPFDRLRKSMFGGMAYRYAGFLGYDAIGDRNLRRLGIRGAKAMVDLFHPEARQVPIGRFRTKGLLDTDALETDDRSGDYLSSVDNVYTAVSILWRAAEETGKTPYLDVARAHVDQHIEWFIRPDGSTWHKVSFDPNTGDEIETYNQLAHGDNTCWSRGQAWSIAGLAYAYRHTSSARYLKALRRQVAYYRSHTPPNLVPYWDFEIPEPNGEPRDTSAAAITAYGLLSLPDGDQRATPLQATGRQILATLIEEYTVTDDQPLCGQIQQGCYNPIAEYATDDELIWTAFYVFSALQAAK